MILNIQRVYLIFFLERPSLKSGYFLINLKDHVSETSLQNIYNLHPKKKKEQNKSLDLIKIAIQRFSFKVDVTLKRRNSNKKKLVFVDDVFKVIDLVP